MKKLLFFVFIISIQQLQAKNCLNEDENEFLEELLKSNTENFKKIGWSFDNDFSEWKGLTVKNCSIIEIDIVKGVTIKKLPNTIIYLKNLEILSIRVRNNISRNLFSLPKLKKLHIEGYLQNKKAFAVFDRLQSLRFLKLKVSLKKIPNKVFEMSNLEYLDLSENYLESLPEKITNLKNLRHINLSENSYLKGPLEVFNSFNNLTYLNLKKTEMSGWFSSSSKKLSYLNLSELNMRDGILDIFNTNKLEVLKINNTGLKEIKGIQNQTDLRIVDLSDNYIKSSKDFTFKLCKQLDSLNLSKNELTSIPDFGLSPKHINISSNPIFLFTTKDYENLEASKSIDFSFMSIDKLSPAIKKLENCETLNLSNNNLEELPNELKHCEKLKNLDVSSNRLKVFSLDFQKLKQLERLNLRKNLITDFSLVLPNLKELILVENQFTQIPPVVFKHKKLELFYIGDFEMKRVPDRILELKELKDLYVPFIGENDPILCKLKKGGMVFKHMYVECK